MLEPLGSNFLFSPFSKGGDGKGKTSKELNLQMSTVESSLNALTHYIFTNGQQIPRWLTKNCVTRQVIWPKLHSCVFTFANLIDCHES